MLTFDYNAEPFAVAAVEDDVVYAKPLNLDGSVSRRKAQTFNRNMVENATERGLKEGIRPEMARYLKPTTLEEIQEEEGRMAVFKPHLICD